MRLALPGNPNVPIYLATLAPKALELTGELADGWLGTSFTPEHAEAHLAHLRRGAESAGRSLRDVALCVGAPCAITDDPEPLIAARKPHLAFTLGAMGSASTNFYNDAYRRGGFAEAAEEVQRVHRENGALARAFEKHVRRVVMTADNALLFLQMEYEKHGRVTEGMTDYVSRSKQHPTSWKKGR